MLPWLLTALMAVVLLMVPVSVQAAEILQVRSGTVLQVGDHNRTYTVELACLAIPPDGDAAAAAWLRNALPRRTRVNLRPLGNADGTLVARVQRLGTAGSPAENDMGAGLVAAGLASPQQGC